MSTAAIFTECDMVEVSAHEAGPGRAIVVSRRCPGKETPNEDAAAIIAVDDERVVLAVADGLGGRPGGESAAATAVRTIEAQLHDIAGNGDTVRTAILDALEHANQTIMDLAIGAGTTMAIVEIERDRLRAYNIGDSAVLAVGQRGKLKLQTVAHSPTGYAVESGLLDAADALHHEERHLVSNLIGDTAMRIEIGSWRRMDERDTVVLATDGLFDNLHADEIIETVRVGPLTAACERLVTRCTARMTKPRPDEPSKPDDLTVILFRRARARQRRAA